MQTYMESSFLLAKFGKERVPRPLLDLTAADKLTLEAGIETVQILTYAIAFSLVTYRYNHIKQL